MKIMEWQNLGEVPYAQAFDLQERLRQRRIAGDIPDRLLVLEHPPVITLGRRDCDGDIVSPPHVVDAAGIEVVKTNRGGRATYHGPGQIVGYFICSLDAMGIGIREFVRSVEEVCMQALGDFGVVAGRDPEHPGIWVGQNKIVAIGMNVSHGVTQHGFAMNVSCDLEHYRHIIACGINDRGVTSIERELGEAPSPDEVKQRILARMTEVTGCTMVRIES
jgi:lipoyl(octanoyl) transferase